MRSIGLFSTQATDLIVPKIANAAILSENINVLSKFEVIDPPSGEQLKLLELLRSGQNVYFTGKAGTGKTIALKHFINYLKENKIIYAVTVLYTNKGTHRSSCSKLKWPNLAFFFLSPHQKH
jgi:Cdc6-like AAA superfamily ATPase